MFFSEGRDKRMAHEKGQANLGRPRSVIVFFFLSFILAGGALCGQPSAFAEEHGHLWLKVVKKEYKLYVMKDNETIDSFDVAVGKNRGQKKRAGDNRTPEGEFYIEQIQNSLHWTYDFKDGKGVIKGAYGPWFIRLKTGWSGIGIHGTHDPGSVGTDATEGCIRLTNEDVSRLKDNYITLSMKVVIE